MNRERKKMTKEQTDIRVGDICEVISPQRSWEKKIKEREGRVIVEIEEMETIHREDVPQIFTIVDPEKRTITTHDVPETFVSYTGIYRNGGKYNEGCSAGFFKEELKKVGKKG